MGRTRSNARPPDPDLPPQRDVGTVTVVNRLNVRTWSIRLTNQVTPILDEGGNETGEFLTTQVLGITVRSTGRGKDSDGENPDDVVDMEKTNIVYEVSTPLARLSREFQDAVALIGEDVTGFATNSAFPAEEP